MSIEKFYEKKSNDLEKQLKTNKIIINVCFTLLIIISPLAYYLNF